MIVIAHAGHYALGFLEATPLLAVAAFALWKTRTERHQRHSETDRHDGVRATGSHA
jgi:hypothetical protein